MSLSLVTVTAACGDEDDTTLYQRLGEEQGIRTVINDFVGRVVGDQKINGFFLNKSLDGTRLVECLVAQVGNATGGPQAYPDPAKNCRDMKTSHTGLGISMNDFNDLVGHLVAALSSAGVKQDDIDAIAGVLGPLAPDIVEDANNDATVYQRLGRKPGISGAVDAFIVKVIADSRINGFFTQTQIPRLKTCLVRQLSSIDGPIRYGEEVAHPSDPGVSADKPCADMLSSHQNLRNGANQFISIQDFNALVGDLVEILDGAGVPVSDKTAILGALGPLCNEIVKNGTGCP